MYPLTIN